MESAAPPLLLPLIAGQGRICMTGSNVGVAFAPRMRGRCGGCGPHKLARAPTVTSRRGKLAGEDFCIWNSKQRLFREEEGRGE